MPPQGVVDVNAWPDIVNHPEIWVNYLKRLQKATDAPMILHQTHPDGAIPA